MLIADASILPVSRSLLAKARSVLLRCAAGRAGPRARFARAVGGVAINSNCYLSNGVVLRARMKGTYRRGLRSSARSAAASSRRPEKAAWRCAWHQAEVTPRFTPGTIRMMDLDVRYSDLLSFCPQWDDIFVKRTLAFDERVRVAAHSRLRRQRRPGEPVLLAGSIRRRASPRSKPTRRCSRSSTPTSRERRRRRRDPPRRALDRRPAR